MLKFGKIKRGSAIMSRTIKAQLKQANLYTLFCGLVNKIKKSGITCVELSKQAPLMLQALVSFCSMSKVEKQGLDNLVLAVMLKKDQISTSFAFYKGRPGVTALLSFETAEFCFGDLYLHFGNQVVVIAA